MLSCCISPLFGMLIIMSPADLWVEEMLNLIACASFFHWIHMHASRGGSSRVTIWIFWTLTHHYGAQSTSPRLEEGMNLVNLKGEKKDTCKHAKHISCRIYLCSPPMVMCTCVLTCTSTSVNYLFVWVWHLFMVLFGYKHNLCHFSVRLNNTLAAFLNMRSSRCYCSCWCVKG